MAYPDPEPNPEPTYIDPVTLKILNIDKIEAEKQGYLVAPMDLETSYNVNKGALGGISVFQYKDLYENVMGNELFGVNEDYMKRASNEKTTTTEVENIINSDKRNTWLVNPNVLGYTSKRPHKIYESHSVMGDIGEYYDRHGNTKYTMTAEETADAKGYFLKQGLFGVEKLDLSEYQKANEYGSYYRIDAQGNRKILTLDSKSRTWFEYGDDAVVASNTVRSQFGPKKAESGIFENMASNSWNTIVDQTYGSAGTVSEMMGTFANWIVGKDDPNTLQKWGRSMQNAAGGYKSKISEAVENEGMFGSWRAGLGTTANAITQVASQALVGRIFGFAGQPVMAFLQAGNFVRAAKLAKSLYQGAPWAFGAAYAGQAMNDEAKAAGLDDKSRAVMSLLAMGAMYASEYGLHYMGGKGIVDMFGDDMLTKQLDDAFRQNLRKAANEVKESGLAGLSDDAAGQMMQRAVTTSIDDATRSLGINLQEPVKKGFLQSMKLGLGKAIYSDNPGSLWARAISGVYSGVEEGAEEVIEGGINAFSKTIYNNYWANPNAEPGAGKFHNTSWENPIGEFFAGGIGGGFMGFVLGGRKRININKDYSIATLYLNKGLKDGKKYLTNLQKGGMLDNPLLDENDQFIQTLPEDQREQAMSLNDIAYNGLVKQLEEAHQIVQMTGLTDPEKITKLMGGDMKLAKDALANMLWLKRTKMELAQMKDQYENLSDGSEKTEMGKNIQEQEDIVQQKEQLVSDILNGTAVDKYKAINLIRTYNAAKNASLPDDEKITKEMINDAFGKSINELEENDDWNDEEKAYRTVNAVKEFNKQYNDSVEEYNKKRKDSQEFADFISNFNLDQGTLDDVKSILDELDNNKNFSGGKKSVLRSMVGDSFTKMSGIIQQEKKKIQDELKTNDKVKAEVDEVYRQLLDDEGITDETTLSDDQRNEYYEEAFDEVLGKSSPQSEIGKIIEENNQKIKQEITPLEERQIDAVNSNLDDDQPAVFAKGLKKMSQLANAETGQLLELSSLMADYAEEGQGKQEKYYTVTDNKTNKTSEISKDEYEKSKTAASTTDDNFDYDGKSYNSNERDVDPKAPRVFSAKRTVYDKDNNKEKEVEQDVLGVEVTPVGKSLIALNDFIDEIKKINNEINQVGINDEILAKLEDLRNRIKELYDNILFARGIQANKDKIPSNIHEWLGLNNHENTVQDYNAVLLNLESQLDYVEQYINFAKQINDIREKMFENYRKAGFKQMAVFSNKLLNYFTSLKDVVVQTDVLDRPKIFASKDLNDEEVIKAMQYWHHYFNQMDKDEFIKTFEIFWASSVLNLEKDANGDYINKNKNNQEFDNNSKSEKQGMFVQDFDEYIDDFESDDYFVNHKTEDKFRLLSYYHLMNIAYNMDLGNFYYKLHELVEDPNSYQNGAHTSEQILNLLQVTSFLNENSNMQMAALALANDPTTDQSWTQKHDFYKNIMKIGLPVKDAATGNMTVIGGLYDRLVDSTGAYINSGKHVQDNTILVSAPGGAGKTSYIVRTIIEYASDITHQGKKVILVVRNQNQLNELEKSALDAGLRSSEYEALVVNDFLEKQHLYKDNLIIIDEVSLLTPEEKNAMYFQNYYKTHNGKELKIAKRKDGSTVGKIDQTNTVIFLGDEFQPPFDPINEMNQMKFSASVQHTTSITQVKRTSFKDIFMLQNMFRQQISKLAGATLPNFDQSFLYADEMATTNEMFGVRLEDNEADFFEIAKRVNSVDNAYLVVLTETDKLKAEQAGIDSKKIKVMTDPENTPQGMTMSEVYVYVPATYFQSSNKKDSAGNYTAVDKINYLKYLNMAVSRGKNFVMLYSNGFTHKSSNKVDKDQLEIFQSNRVEENKQKLTQTLNDHIRGSWILLPQNYVVKQETPTKKTQAEIDKELNDIVSKRGIGAKFGKYKINTDVTKINNTSYTYNAETSKEVATVSLSFNPATETWEEKIVNVVAKNKPQVPLSKKKQKEKIKALHDYKTNDNIDLLNVNGVVTNVVINDNKDQGIEKVITVEEENRKPSTILVAIDQFGNELPLFVIKGEKIDNTDPDDSQDDLSTTEIKITDFDGDEIYELVFAPENEDGIVISVGATYQIIDIHGNKVNRTVSSIFKNDKGEYVLSFKSKASKKAGMDQLDVKAFYDSVLRFKKDNTGEVSIDEISDKGLTSLFSDRQLFFTNNYQPLSVSEITQSQDEIAALYGTKSRETFMKLLEAANQNFFKYKIVVRRNKDVNFTSYDAKVSKPDYYYVLQYSTDNATYSDVAYIPVYGDENRKDDTRFYKSLYNRAKDAFANNPTLDEIVVTKDKVAPGSNAFVTNTFVRHGKGNKMQGVELSRRLQEYGFSLQKIEYNGDEKTIKAIYTNGTVEYAIPLEAKQLQSNVPLAVDYVNQLISALEKTTSDEAIKDMLGNKGFVGMFHEFNKSQMFSDIDIQVKWMQDLVNSKVLIQESAGGVPIKKYRVNGDINKPQGFKGNMLKYLNALKESFSNKQMPQTKVRFTPKYNSVNGYYEINDFNTSDGVSIINPMIVQGIDSNVRGLLREDNAEFDKIEYDGRLAEAQTEMDSLIGKGSGLEFAPDLLQTENAHGKITKLGKIILNVQNGMTSIKALYHEVAHYVAEFLITDSERRMLYEEGAKKMQFIDFDYNNLTHRFKVAEYFARTAERFAYDRRNMKGLTKMFTNFLDYVKYVLDRFGILKDITHRYMYDIYVNKKYALSETVYKETNEMPYNELYRAEDFRDFSILEDYFGNNEMARKASSKVAVFMANQFTRPNLNSRLFLDENVQYKDIVNRTENAIRNIVMFETDNNGRYVRYEKGHEFEGQLKLREDSRGDKFSIMFNKQYYDLFKYELNPTDDSGVQHLGVRLMYFSREKGKYVVAKPNSKGILFSETREKNYIRKMIKEAAKEFYIETTEKDEDGTYQEITAFLNNNPETKRLSSKIAQMPDYQNFMMAMAMMDNNNFASAINRHYQNIDAIGYIIGKNRKETDSEVMLKMMEHQDVISRESSETINPMDRLSNFVKTTLMTTPMYVYAEVEENEIKDEISLADYQINYQREAREMGGKYYALMYIPSNYYMNIEEISKLMIQIKMNNEGNSVESFMLSMQQIINQKERAYSKNKTDVNEDRELRMLMSIYKEHFSLERGDISTYKIVNWHERLVKFPDSLDDIYRQYVNSVNLQKRLGMIDSAEPLLDKDTFAQNIETRAKHASNVINALVTSFGSLSTDNYSKIKMWDSSEGYRASIRSVGSKSSTDKKMELEQHLYNTYLTENSLHQGYVNLFAVVDNTLQRSPDGTRNPYTIFKIDGIYYKDSKTGLETKIISINENGVIESANLQSIKNAGVNAEVALKSIFNEVFNKQFKPFTYKKFASANVPGLKQFGWNETGKTFGPMILAAYVYGLRKYKGQAASERELVNVYENALSKFKPGNPNYGKVTDEARDIVASGVKADEFTGVANRVSDEDYYHPAGYYEELEKIGSVLATIEGGYRTPYFIGVNNKKKYLDTVQDSIGYNLNDGGKNYAYNFRRALRTGRAINNFNHVDGIILNPFLGEKNTYYDEMETEDIAGMFNQEINQDLSGFQGFVKEWTYMDSVEVYTGKKAEFDKLSNKNLAEIQLRYFLPNLDASERGFAMSPSYTWHYTQGDRTRVRSYFLNWFTNGYKAQTFANSNGILSMKKNDQGNNIFDLDSDNIFVHVANIFRMTEKIAHNSLVKWANVILDINQTDLINFGDTTLTRQDAMLQLNDPDYINKKFELANKVIKAINLLNNAGGFNILPNNQIQEFFGKKMRSGVDYNIIVENGQKRVYLGHGANMNNDIFNQGQRSKKNPEKVFTGQNYYTKRKIVIDNPFEEGKKTKVPVSVAELVRGMDENGDTYIDLENNIGQAIRVKIDKETKKKLLYKLFGKTLRDTNEKLKSYEYRIRQEDLAKLGETTDKDSILGIKLGDKYVTAWAGLEMAHKLYNMYFQYAFEGSLSQEMDNVINFDSSKTIQWSSTNNKRSSIHSSTFVKPTYDGYNGLDSEGDIIIVSEIVTSAEINGYKNLSTNSHVVFDGQSTGSKLDAVMTHKASGGELNGVNKEGMGKNVGIIKNIETGESVKLKHAEHIPSFQSMEYMPSDRIVQEILHNPYARPIVEGFGIIYGNQQIRENNIPLEQDSIWQRYLIHETESLYLDAVEKMENHIYNKGGLESYIKSGNYTEGVQLLIDQLNKSKKDGIPNFVHYDNLVSLFNMMGDTDMIEEPSNIVNYEWAWSKTADFYKKQRALGNTGVNQNGENMPYRYVKMIAQRDATIKQKSQEQTMPIDFANVLAGSAGKSVDAGVSLNHLITPSGIVPTDLFTAYFAWKQEAADMPIDQYSYRFNNRDLGFQLNANRDVEDSTESPMIQLMNIILASPEQHENGKSTKMMDIIANNIKIALEKFDTDRNSFDRHKRTDENYISSSEEQILNMFIKEKVSVSMSKSDDTSMLNVIIKNDKININVSGGSQERVYQYIASYIRKEAIKRKQSAMRLVQAGGNHTELYRFTHSDGSVEAFSYSGAISYASKALGLDIPMTDSKIEIINFLEQNGFTKDTLKHTTISLTVQPTEADIERMAKDLTTEQNKLGRPLSDKEMSEFKTRWYIKNDLATVDKGEAIVPASKFSEYNIPKHTTFNGLFRLLTIDNGKYVDNRLKELAFNGKKDRKSLFDIINFNANNQIVFTIIPSRTGQSKVKAGYGEGMVKGDNTYFDHLFLNYADAWVKSNYDKVKNFTLMADEELRKEGVANYNKKYLNKGAYNQQYYNDLTSLINNYIKQDETYAEGLLENVNTYTSGLIANALAVKDAVGVRLPSGPGSGFYVDVVGFVNDNGSTGYINTIKNLIDGSDQDIDQFTFYYKQDTLKELGFNDDEVNQIFAKKKKESEENENEQEFDKSQKYKEALGNNNNDLMDLVFDFYANPKNNILTGSPIEMSTIARVADENIEKLMPDGDNIHGVGMSILYRRASYDGKTVGDFARSQKVQTMLAKSYWNNNMDDSVFNFTLFPGLRNFNPGQYIFVPSRVEALVNSATDNIKDQKLGKLNISIKNSMFVGTTSLANNEIIDFVRKYPERYNITAEQASVMSDEELHIRFMTGQAFTDIDSFMKSNDDVFSYNPNPKLFESAATYYMKLQDPNNEMDKKLTELSNKILQFDLEIQRVLNEMGVPVESFGGNFRISNIEKVLRETTSPKYTALRLALVKEMEKSLSAKANDTAETIAENLDDEMGVEDPTSIDKKKIKNDAYYSMRFGNLFENLINRGYAITEAKTYIDQLEAEYNNIRNNVATIILNSRSKYYLESQLDNILKKKDKAYQEEIYLIAKHAMLGEWFNGMAAIADINQFKITSPYEQERYSRNLEMMTGRTMEQMIDLYEMYQKEKQNNDSLNPIEFLKTNGDMTVAEKWSAYEKLNQHNIAQKDKKHMTNVISIDKVDANGNVVSESFSYKNDFHKIGNAAALLLAAPNVMESIIAVKKLKSIEEQLFFSSHPIFKDIRNRMEMIAGIDFYNETSYRTFTSKVHDYYVSEFISYSDKLRDIYRVALNNIKDSNDNSYLDKPFVGINGIGTVASFESASSRRDFVEQFPVFFETVLLPQMMNEIKESPNNIYRNSQYATDLINRLTVTESSGLKFIEIINGLTQTSDDEQNMRQGFLDLDKNIADLLSVYQIVKTGFEYQKGFLAKVMPEKFYEIYSDYINERSLNKDLLMADIEVQEDLMKQLLYDPTNNFLRGETFMKRPIDGKMRLVSIPPIASYGYSAMYKKTAYRYSKGKFGTTKITATAVLQQSDYIHAGMSSSSNESINIPIAVIFNENDSLPINYQQYEHTSSGLTFDLKNVSMSKYLRYFIKGDFEKQYENVLSKMPKIGDVYTNEQKKQAAQQTFEWFTNQYNNPSSNSGNVYYKKIIGEESTFANANREASIKWYRLIADKLNETLSDAQFRDLYNSLKGKVIIDKSITPFSPATVLSEILNLTQGNKTALVNLDAIEDPSQLMNEPIVKMYLNRLTNIGNNLDRHITDNVIVEIKTSKNDELYKTLFNLDDTLVYMSRYSNDRNLFRSFVAEVNMAIMNNRYNLDAVINNPNYQIFSNLIRTKYGVSSSIDIAKVVSTYTDQWNERNADLTGTLNRHSKIAEMNNYKGPIDQSYFDKFKMKLQRTGDVVTKIGDIIYFPTSHRAIVVGLKDPITDFEQNIKGYKTVEYVLDVNYRPGIDRTMRAKMSMEDNMRSNNAFRAIESAVNIFSKSMPNVPYEIITNDMASNMGESGSASFYKNGIVYINADKADSAVVLHEFAHPFVLALENENNALWTRLAEQVSANTEVMNFVKNKYPELTNELDIIREAIPTFLQMRMYKRLWLEQSNAERLDWKDYFVWVEETFTSAMSDVDVMPGSLFDLDFENATLSQISDAIINDFMEGNILSLSNPGRHAVPYTMKASTSSKVKNINLSNIDKIFQIKGDQSEIEEARQFISSGINSAVATGDVYYGINDTYNFSRNNPAYFTNGNFDNTKFDQTIEKAINNEISFHTAMDVKMLNFFTMLQEKDKSALSAAVNTIHTAWDKIYDIKNLTDSELQALNDEVEKMLIHIGYDKTFDKAFTLEEAQTYLGVKLPTNIKGKPIVIVHDAGTENESISILDITTLGLRGHGIGDSATLGDSIQEKDELTRQDRSKLRRVTLMNTNQDINALKNSIIAMALKNEKPTLKINKIGSVRITSRGYEPHFMYMEDIVVPLKELFDIKYFKENLERDIFDLVSNETLLNPNTYKIAVMDKLKYYVQSRLAQNKDVKNGEKLSAMKDLIANVEGDHMKTNMRELAKAIRARLYYLRNEVYGNDSSRLALSQEYNELASIYMDITAYDDINVSKVTAIDYDEKFLKTADRWHGKVRTWVFDSLDTAMRKSKELIMPFQAKMMEMVDELNKANPHLNLLTDSSHKLFDKIIKKRKIKDKKTGQMVEINMQELHWDENDSETRALLNSGDLSRTELEFSKWLADELYNEFIDYIIEVEHGSVAKGNDTYEDIRAAAELMVNTRYKKGMLPVFTKSFSSALSEGNIAKAFKLFTDNAGKWYGGNIYSEYQQSQDADSVLTDGKYHKLLSPFWSQFTSASLFGSQSRMNMLGIGYENGELMLFNNDRNEDVSKNLQNVGLFTKAASTRARTMKEAITNVNIALDILRAEEKQKGIKTDDIILQVENYVNRQVYGNLPETGVWSVYGATLNIDAACDAGGKLIYMIHMAINPILGAKNAASASMKGFISSLANAMSGSKMFTPVDVVKAISEVVANPAKVEKINRKYQLVNITERDLLNHWKNNQSRKNIMETDFQMMFHWFGDHYTQLIGSVAQMINDGTYFAHDENGEYDPTLDERFQGENGKIIMEDVMKRQYLENYHVPQNGKMTHAYSQRDENRIKVINQRYVGELNDNQYKNMISSFGIARAVMNLKNYIYNVKQFYWSNTRPDVFIGGRTVVDGKVVWEPVMAEGVLNTIIYMVDQVRKGEKMDMNSFRRRNIASAGASLLVLSSLYFVVDALTEGFDDDDDKKKKTKTPYHQRLFGQLFGEKGYNVRKDQKELNYAQQVLRYVLAGGANENLSYLNPLKSYHDSMNYPNTFMMQIGNILDAFVGTLTLPAELSGFDDDTFWKDIDEYVLSLSKVAPYGSNYKVMRNGTEQILKDFGYIKIE